MPSWHHEIFGQLCPLQQSRALPFAQRMAVDLALRQIQGRKILPAQIVPRCFQDLQQIPYCVAILPVEALAINIETPLDQVPIARIFGHNVMPISLFVTHRRVMRFAQRFPDEPAHFQMQGMGFPVRQALPGGISIFVFLQENSKTQIVGLMDGGEIIPDMVVYVNIIILHISWIVYAGTGHSSGA